MLYNQTINRGLLSAAVFSNYKKKTLPWSIAKQWAEMESTKQGVPEGHRSKAASAGAWPAHGSGQDRSPLGRQWPGGGGTQGVPWRCHAAHSRWAGG